MIGGDFTDQYDVIRWNYPGTYPNGLFVADPRDPQTFQIWASIQPLKGAELLLLPEGERLTTTLKLYTVTLLRSAQQGSQTSPQTGLTKADVVVYNGNQYEVQKVEHYDRIRWHYKCLLKSVLPPEG